MSDRSFKELFCARVGCAVEDYERVALRRCCYPRAVPLLKYLSILGTESLGLSREVIIEAGKATSADQFRDAIRDFRLAVTDKKTLFDLKLRLSSTLLLRWVELFPEETLTEKDVFDTDRAVKGEVRSPASGTATAPKPRSA